MGITALVGASLALGAYGTVKQVEATKQASSYQQQSIAAQQRAEAVRQQAMQLDARRKTLENLRNAQKARAAGLATATSQGAQFGSGLQGGYGQVSGQSNVMNLGISQALQSGEQLFDINADISQSKIGMARSQADAAVGAGISSLGGALMSSATTLNAIGTTAFGSGGKIGYFDNGGGFAPTWR